MSRLRKAIIAVVVLLSVLVVTTIIAAVVIVRMPSGTQHIMAFFIGAEYLGRDGVTIQTKGKNCGAAVLKMMCDHYKIAVTLKDIDSSIEVTNQGASMIALKTYAESKMLHANGWRLTYEEFEHQQFPMILFVNNNHFVVADSTHTGETFLRDPSIGKLKISKINLLKIWKGEALIFSM